MAHRPSSTDRALRDRLHRMQDADLRRQLEALDPNRKQRRIEAQLAEQGRAALQAPHAPYFVGRTLREALDAEAAARRAHVHRAAFTFRAIQIPGSAA